MYNIYSGCRYLHVISFKWELNNQNESVYVTEI